MTIFVSIVAFLIIIILAILVHEMGHFITAKLSGVKVEEFGIGMPPRIWGVQKGETIYSINWIPLGGFCRMAGEVDPSVPRSLASKSIKARLLVLSAGSLFMLLFPLFLLPVSYMTPISRPAEDAGVLIESIAPGSPAEMVGLEIGDIVLSIDDQEVHTTDDIHQAIEPKRGTEVTLLISRNDAELEKTIVPRTEEETPEGEGAMGILMGAVMEVKAYPPWQAVPRGLSEYGQMYIDLGVAFGQLFRGEVNLNDALTGPIGIGHLTSVFVERLTEQMIRFTVVIFILMGIFNLLPIPGLDGGHLLFIAIEGVRRGKRISPKKEGFIHLVGFALLLGLVAAVSYNDILRLIEGRGFGP
jgi:regulator of sigma E protease